MIEIPLAMQMQMTKKVKENLKTFKMGDHLNIYLG